MTSNQNPSNGRERGFTMAELLIVVAIIAVLVAIAVPVFSAQLEKSREAVDLANTRSAYAALQATKIEGTNPDGTTPGSEGLVFCYAYTGNGFEAKTPNISLADEAITLVSNADYSFLSDYIVKPSDLFYGTEYPTLKGNALVAYKRNDNGEYVLTLMPPSWLISTP